MQIREPLLLLLQFLFILFRRKDLVGKGNILKLRHPDEVILSRHDHAGKTFCGILPLLAQSQRRRDLVGDDPEYLQRAQPLIRRGHHMPRDPGCVGILEHLLICVIPFIIIADTALIRLRDTPARALSGLERFQPLLHLLF